MNRDELLSRIRRIVNGVHVMAIATADENGSPHAANVYFAADEALDLYFVSDAASAHSAHIVDRPDAAVSIYPQVDDYMQIRGLQLRGCVCAVSDDEWESAWLVYLAKFPFVAKLTDMVQSQQLCRLTPRWLRYIDNRVEFGFKWETAWPMPTE